MSVDQLDVALDLSLPLRRRFDFGVTDATKEAAWMNRLRLTTSTRQITVRDLETGLMFAVLPSRAVYLYDNQGAAAGCVGCRLPRGHLFACGDAATRGLLTQWRVIEKAKRAAEKRAHPQQRITTAASRRRR